jgi:transcriptional antiterminator RfaH
MHIDQAEGEGAASSSASALMAVQSGAAACHAAADSGCPKPSRSSTQLQGVMGGWYVCLTKPRQEAYAVAKLAEQGYQVYLPLLDSWARRAGKWCKKQSVMFPRYAFVRPQQPGHSIAPVRSTPGITSLVKFGPVLATLPHSKLQALQALVNLRAQALPGQPFAEGQQVVFASGPFKGLAGLVSSVADERVCVLMTLLGQQQQLQTRVHTLAAA